jgi:ATP-binding cassette subfamily F protein 3
MRAAIDGRLANPLLYKRGDADEIETLNRKRGELEAAFGRAEALWMAALEKLEAAEGVGA